ncbi:uncharacterized protein METZ01_LOCUS168917 [marine metagenome]|uniref:Uncharacterized protein n=1 Tax=marine metagenome TaxID=408172 RepID=A0A382BSL7_9ZZZZ
MLLDAGIQRVAETGEKKLIKNE